MFSRVGPLTVACLVALAVLASNASAAQPRVELGTVDTFAVLAGTTVTNAGFSTLNGDLGVSPGTALTGFPPGTVNGTTHAADPVAAQAQADLTTAYNNAAGRTPPNALPADVGGSTLAPGVYRADPSLGLTGTLTLDGQGDPNAVFVFQVGSALTTAVGSRVNLINGAQPCNVSWQIGSSARLGTSSVFAGNILALSSISMNDGVTLNGRALARNGAVTLINDTITAAHCAPGTNGGDTIGGDRRRPSSPRLLSPRKGARVPAGTVRFRWSRAARAAHYTLMVDDRRMNTGSRTRATMRVRAGTHGYRVIARNSSGARSSSVRAFSATEAPPVDEIRRRLGLDALEKEVVKAAERITLAGAEAATFRSALRSVGKFVSRVGILGFLASIGLEDGDLSCEQGPLYSEAKPVFKNAADVFKRAARAKVGPHRADLAKLAKVRRDLKALERFIDGNDVVEECEGPNKVALKTIETLQPRLEAAGKRLKKLSTRPSKKACSTAQKLLKEYERLFPKVNKGKKLSPKRTKELDRKRKARTITFDDLPGSLKKGFPGELKGYTLEQIEALCKL